MCYKTDSYFTPIIQTSIYINIAFIALSLPFSITLNSVLIILLFLQWLIYNAFFANFHFKDSRSLMLFILFFATIVIGSFDFVNFNFDLFSLEKRASLIAFPVIFSSLPILSKQSLRSLFLCFVLSTLIISLFTFRHGLEFYFAENRIWAVGELLLMHRPYLGIYCSVSIVFLFYLLNNSASIFLKAIYFLIILYFVLFIYLITAKAALISLIFVGYLISNIILFKRGENSKMLFLNTIILLIIILIVLTNENAFVFLIKILKFDFIPYDQYDSIVVDSFNKRFEIWKCNANVLFFDGKWLNGVGFMNIETVLNDCYIRNGKPFLAEQSLNSHNQYLQIWLGGGIWSFTSFILLLTFMIIKSIKEYNLYLLAFVLLFVVCFFVESMLAAQKGVALFSLFISIFSFVYPQKLERE